MQRTYNYIQEHWLTRRYISVTKNLTCVIQTPVWTVERAPGQHLEGIGVSARRDMAERTAQVNTNDSTLRSIKWNYSETRDYRNVYFSLDFDRVD